MTEKLLILDLDETLILGTETSLDRPADFVVDGEFHVYKRPGIDEFLAFCRRTFRVAVWTSATADYALPIVTRLFAGMDWLDFCWCRDRCTRRIDRSEPTDFVWLKNLKKVRRRGFLIEQILAIDDTPECYARNYGNHIHVQPFAGNQADRELEMLARFLDRIKDVPDIRTVEKRCWRRWVT